MPARCDAHPKVRFVTVDPTGSMVWIRPNHLQPPFDNPKARQALLHAIDQTAILQAIGAPAENARPFCGSFPMCGTPLETKAGTAGLETPDLEKAKALLKELGYGGRPVVFMQPSELAANFNATVVVAEGMRKSGFKVDIQPLDWGTLSQRRSNKGPVDANNKGGWNLFITVATALDASTPLTNVYLATPCPNDVAGFPCDEELQRLRRSWWESTDEAERARARRPDPGAGVPGRAVHQRRAVEAVHGGAGERVGAGGDNGAGVLGGGEGGVMTLHGIESIAFFKLLHGSTGRSSRPCTARTSRTGDVCFTRHNPSS